jgi:hypothetical protein
MLLLLLIWLLLLLLLLLLVLMLQHVSLPVRAEDVGYCSAAVWCIQAFKRLTSFSWC